MSYLISYNNSLNINYDEFSESSYRNIVVYNNLQENSGNSDNDSVDIDNSYLLNFNSNCKKKKTEELLENTQSRNNEKLYESNSFHNCSASNKSVLDFKNYIINNLNNVNNVNNLNNLNILNNNNTKENKKLIGKKIGKEKENRIKKPKFITENPSEKTLFNFGYFDENTKKTIKDALTSNIKKNNKKRRMYRTDEIIIKFMGKLFKKLINRINIKLKISKSKKFFRYLPDCFIKEYKKMILKAKKKKNLADIDFTLETIFSTEFFKIEKEILKDNIETIKYLKKAENKTIYENSNFYIFKDYKFSQILKEFFNSKEFGMDISVLKDENQEIEYIKEYIIKVEKFVNFFI